jgi:hypothetical protein
MSEYKRKYEQYIFPCASRFWACNCVQMYYSSLHPCQHQSAFQQLQTIRRRSGDPISAWLSLRIQMANVTDRHDSNTTADSGEFSLAQSSQFLLFSRTFSLSCWMNSMVGLLWPAFRDVTLSPIARTHMILHCWRHEWANILGGLISLWLYKENNKLRDWKNIFILHIPPWAPHTYDFLVLNSLTHPRKINLVVLQIGK